MGCPSLSPHPLGMRDGTDSWDRGLQIGHHGMSSLFVHPLGTERWDRQLGQRPVIGDSMGCPSLSVHSLGVGTEGWDGQLGQRPTDGTPWDVPHCPLIPWGLRDAPPEKNCLFRC